MGMLGPNIKKLEKRGDIEGLGQALMDERSKTREAAAAALGRLGWEPDTNAMRAWHLAGKRSWQELADLGESALPPLLEGIQHHEDGVRNAVWPILEQTAISHRVAAVPLMCEVLCDRLMGVDIRDALRPNRDRTAEARNRMVEFLGRLGDPRAVLPLIRSKSLLLKDGPQGRPGDFAFDTRMEYSNLVRRAISEIGEPAAGRLVEALSSTGTEFEIEKLTLASMLGDLGSSALAPALELMDHENQWVRSCAIDVLEKMEDTRATERIAEALRDEACPVRTSAASVLGRRSWQPADPQQNAYFLFAQVIHSCQVHQYADADGFEERLLALGEQAVGPLTQFLHLKDRVPVGQRKGVKMLTEDPIVYDERTVGKLAHTSILRIGKVAVEPLVLALKDKNTRIRSEAADLLGRIGDPKAAQPLTSAMNDDDEKVRKAAAKALTKLK